jgi:hypothetical protein
MPFIMYRFKTWLQLRERALNIDFEIGKGKNSPQPALQGEVVAAPRAVAQVFAH